MNISWEMILPLIVLRLVLAVFALISCIKEERTNGPKWMWVAIIVCINIIGPILFLPSAESKGERACCLLSHYVNRIGIIGL
ncbi:PLD nuclease N-terminal domain-containing protein [Bacillus inaquosorum]|nr:PLD nuclease N-terminal domain-containing protein [Bacillus inaquosorum]